MSGSRSVNASRCLFVGTSLTVVLWVAAAAGVRAAIAGPLGEWRTPEECLVRLCLLVLVVVAGWAWLQAMAGVVDAWRGRAEAERRGGSLVRRLALAACGAALAGALASPAHARAEDPLTGLPLPQRAEGAQRALPAESGPRSSGRRVVRPGDSLWLIAARDLGGRATDQEVADRSGRLYAANRALIGPDPDLIQPGQVLRNTKEKP